MVINVFLDDLRKCPEGFVLTRDVDECILLLQECEVAVLSLDYHLGGNETGFDVAKWIVGNKKWPKEIFLHTSDPVGREQMYHLLKSHAPEKVHIHNGPMRRH
jgi:hypothetical protein